MIGNIVAGITAKKKFSPADLSPLAWYDASDTSTISVSGTAVTQWNDKSNNGYNLTQGTAANRPTSGVSTQNGLNIVTFDGGDGLINATKSNWKPLHDGTKYIIAMAIKFSNSSNPGTVVYPLGNSNGSADVGVLLSCDDRTSQSRNNYFSHFLTRGVAGAAVIDNAANNFIPDLSVYEAVSVLADPTNGTAANRSYLKVETTVANNNTLTNAVSTADPTNNFTLGALPGLTDGITGGFAEVVIVTGTNATADNRDKLMTYLKDKWAI